GDGAVLQDGAGGAAGEVDAAALDGDVVAEGAAGDGQGGEVGAGQAAADAAGGRVAVEGGVGDRQGAVVRGDAAGELGHVVGDRAAGEEQGVAVAGVDRPGLGEG